jgi:hypothetical protein
MDNSNHVLRTRMRTTNHTPAAAARVVRAVRAVGVAAEPPGSSAALVHSARLVHLVRLAAARMLQRSGAAAPRELTF